jgi:hypothetical protein
VRYCERRGGVRRQKEWQFSGPVLRYGFPPSGPCG